MGYFGFSYYEQNQDKLNAGRRRRRRRLRQAERGDDPSGEYKPLSRPLFMYPSEKAIARPEVKAFMDYVGRELANDRRGLEDRPDEPGAGGPGQARR